jgi:hypothetical protein
MSVCPPRGPIRSGLVLLLALATAGVACTATYYEVPIETPLRPKLDVSAFQRVLIPGFVSGGSDEIDANQETVRTLKSQLRSRSSLRVIDADTMPLVDIAQDQERTSGAPPPVAGGTGEPLPAPEAIKTERDLEPYERLFANTAWWRQLGEEYQNPLIVTGTILFAPHTREALVQREVEQYDAFGRRTVTPVRSYSEQRGFLLRQKLIFIDGRTGAIMHSETYSEEVLYPVQQNTPALSSYFELMDRVVPNFLSALSDQRIRGTRILLK